MLQKNLRILAAIMFTDIVGYTSMMQEDEKRAKDLRDRHRRVLEKCITEHTGSILQYYGDGTLSIFGSAIEAVRCAAEIQKELKEDPAIPLRIGIHAGDIVYEDEGVYGDGVNVASRIQALSVPGGIFISGKVYDEIKNQADLPAVSLGEVVLKNVKKPVEIFALSGGGLSVPERMEFRNTAVMANRSIAVLPFVNMSNDADNEYFSDGITEEIINALTRVKQLKVTSRTSSFAFKGRNDDIRKIGGELNVDTILEGSVRKFGNKVRITAQLINTSDGYHHWSEVYDRELENIFDIQDEIARSIAEKLSEGGGEEQKEVTTLLSAPKANLEAHNSYLKGLYYWNKWTQNDVALAIDHFREAMEKEPSYALPHSAAANCYVWLGATGLLPPRKAYPTAEELALRALQLDDSLAEGYLSIGLVRLFYYWDSDGAQKNLTRALSLNPGVGEVHYAYSLFLNAKANFSESIDSLRTALLLDPLSPVINTAYGETLLFSRKYDDALRQFERTIRIAPGFQSAVWHIGITYLLKGDYQKAIEVFSGSDGFSSDPLKGCAPLAMAYALSGDKAKTESCLKLLHSHKKTDTSVSLDMELAGIYLALDEKEKVYHYLEKAFEERLGALVFLKVSPLWNKISHEERFKALVEKVGI